MFQTTRLRFDEWTPSHTSRWMTWMKKLKKLELKFVQEQEKRMERIEKLFGARVENKDKCYNCQGYGHFAKNCPKRTRSPSPRSSRNTSPARRDINITRVPNRDRAIRIPVKVHGINTFAVIDTGADATVVSDEVAAKAGIVPDETKSVRLLNATNDSEMNAFGGVTATIQMANHPYEWKVFVAPIRDPILLGIDFMKAIDATIHTGQGDVVVDGDIIAGTYSDDDQQPYACSVVKADKDVIIPAASEKIVLGRVVNPVPNKQAVIGANTLPGGIQIGSCLVNMDNTVPIRLLNLMDHEVRVKKDDMLGKLVEAELVPEGNCQNLDVPPSTVNDGKHCGAGTSQTAVREFNNRLERERKNLRLRHFCQITQIFLRKLILTLESSTHCNIMSTLKVLSPSDNQHAGLRLGSCRKKRNTSRNFWTPV